MLLLATREVPVEGCASDAERGGDLGNGALLLGDHAARRAELVRGDERQPAALASAGPGALKPEPIDTSTPVGREQLHVFHALADFQRELNRDRTRAAARPPRPAVAQRTALLIATTLRPAERAHQRPARADLAYSDRNVPRIRYEEARAARRRKGVRQGRMSGKGHSRT